MVAIYDTTLRDGTQGEGISLSCADKIRIARRLDELGIAFIEGGWPGSNPKDAEFFSRARDLSWRASIAAFGSTRRKGVAPEDDANLRALVAVDAPVCTIFGKASTLHVREVLRASLDENLQMIEDSVAFLRAGGRRVIFDAEHFFDGYGADAAYAVEAVRAAARGGAEVAVLCDTNGGSLPWDVERIVAAVGESAGIPLGVHCHDDSGCGVANSLAAVTAGAVHVQGTINGYGERCGNANLCAVIPGLQLKLGQRAVAGNLAELCEVSRYVAEVANRAPIDQMPYVGKSAFAHKGGVHVAAMRRDETSYQHITPAAVGNRSRVVVSELSGRGNLVALAEEANLPVAAGEVAHVLDEVKALEAQGFSFDAAEASVALMLSRQLASYRPPFSLIDYTVVVEHRAGLGTFAEATVKIDVGGERLHTAAEGNGPVEALDRALRKALLPAFPEVADIALIDYKVRIIDSDHGTGAVTRVLIDTRAHDREWTTVGASANIIEASWLALSDSYEYGIGVAVAAVAEVPQKVAKGRA